MYVGRRTVAETQNLPALNPVSVAVVSGALVVLSKWAQNKSPTVDNAVGVVGIAIGLAILEQMSEQLAAAFAVLILVTIAMVHFPIIVKAAGFGK
jgi:hypothetical protein